MVVKAMFIEENKTPIEYVSTDKYLKVSLIISMAGIFLIGLISCFYEYIQEAGFGLYGIIN